jgi:cell division protein FtsA
MIRNVVVGIDVGTSQTRVVVAEFNKGEPWPKIIGTGLSESKGLRHGYITNIEETTKSIRQAVKEAEKNSGIKIKRAFFSIGGISLGSETSQGGAVISKADQEVTQLDIARAIEESEEALQIMNKRILQVIPVMFKIDGKEIWGRPENMHGLKLEVKTLFITCLEQHLEDLLGAAHEAGVEVIDVIPAPFAESLAALSEKQKIAGCALIDIGAETISAAIFENGKMISLHVFSIGSNAITNDIALGLKIPLEEAEQLKTGIVIGDYPKRKLEQIVEARLADVLELVEGHLKKIKRSGLLPAGVIIAGGGSNLPNLETLAKNYLKLPTKIFALDQIHLKRMRDTSWLVAYGLCVAGRNSAQGISYNSFKRVWQNMKDSLGNLLNQLLP